MEQQKNIAQGELIQNIYNLENQKNILTGIVISRQKLFDKIGTGEIKQGNSFEATIKVGRTKEMVSDSIDRANIRIGENGDELSSLYRQQAEIAKQIKIETMEKDLILIGEYVKKGYISAEILQKHQAELLSLKGADKQKDIVKEVSVEIPVETPIKVETKADEWPHGLTNYEISALASHFSSITNPEKVSILNAFLKSANLKDDDIEEIDRCLEDINNDSKQLFTFGQEEIDKVRINKNHIIDSAVDGLKKIRKIINDPIAYNKTEEKDDSMGMLICAIGQFREAVVFCDRNYEDGVDLFEKLILAKCGTEYSIDDCRENGSVAIVNNPGRVVCPEMNYDSATIEVVAQKEELPQKTEEVVFDNIDEIVDDEKTDSTELTIETSKTLEREVRRDPREFDESIVYSFFEQLKEKPNFEKGINLAQLTKFFPLMKRHSVDPMVDDGSVRPEKINGKIYGLYTPVTTATIDYLMYCKKNKIDIKPAEKKKLQDKIAEMYKDWKSKN